MTGIPSAWLVDEHWGKAYRLKGETTIGRGPQNAIILRVGEVSRLHAEVRFEDGDFRLRGFGSSGTKLNGMDVAEQPRSLREGDRVDIAFTTLRFTHRDPAEIDALEVSRDMPTPRESVEVPTHASIRAAVIPSPKRSRKLLVVMLVVVVLLALATLGVAYALMR
jgi:predicted component of type VI protein secretion system